MEWPLVGRAEQLREVVDAIERGPGSAILQGELGVGKTHLSHAVADSFRTRGWRLESVIGSPAATPIPFGAFSHLLPQPSSTDVTVNLERMRREIVASGDSAGVLLVVDDANYLDSASMALAHRLASSGDASVLATRRTGEPGNEETLTSLWKDGHARLFDVLPLDRASHDELVVRSLGAVRAAGLLDGLWQLTNGNPLFLREILTAAAERNLDEWLESILSARPAPTARITEIISARTGRLPAPAHAALEAVAMAEPVSVDIVAQIADRDAVVELQDRSMVVVDRLGSAKYARTVHPLYGATIRATMPRTRRSALAGELADALMARDMEDAGDALRAAVWLEEAGRTLPAPLAVRAATEALSRGDAPLAEHLATTAAEPGGRSVDGLIALGSALSVQHKPNARETLERALEAAQGAEECVRAALACSRHYGWEGRDLGRASSLLEELIPTISEAGAQSELRAELAFYSAAAGDAVGTIRIAHDVLSDPRADPKAILSALIHSTRARVMLGDFDGLEADLDRGEALALELADDLPLAFDQLRSNRSMWLRSVDLAEALRVASSGYARSLREGGPSAMWSGTLSWISVDTGDLDAALGLVERSFREVERFDPFHNVSMAYSLAALVHGVRGELDEAAAWLERGGPVKELEPRSRVWAERAQVWIASRDPELAISLAINAGRRAEAETIITWGASLLYHDAVRLGGSCEATDGLARLADQTTAPLIHTMAKHARAALDEDAVALAAVAEEFAVCGSPLLAAEALAQAAHCAADELERDRLTVRALHLRSQCPGAVTPLLTGLISPLSEREWEVARLASAGASSPDIARQLYLSVRTVDNHLSAVYKKLGIGGRQDLRLVFTPARH